MQLVKETKRWGGGFEEETRKRGRKKEVRQKEIL